jgi:hypothetical protein
LVHREFNDQNRILAGERDENDDDLGEESTAEAAEPQCDRRGDRKSTASGMANLS